ncbi:MULTISPECIES: thioesterase family protein [unclassified Halomonas]|uniref:thioesterase family protein n=1 Tax=unclassified Halomonas TaxID=2609666 RepID=UPI0005FA92E9|nr:MULTISPECIES: thioesterase family protein [unclassified Halomonas]KJZ05869.1 hypothetical protein TW86_20430 [Halomonas sp. S2151]MAR72167.1 hypothetical protein [Halomonas sp.]MCJ8288026.1 thioesterase family protein [Halomonas sp.]MCO7217777.1 thioesterase family protein [Halomonas sp. OfavH-34-E]NQY73064.1 thioesterase family protein [Halomonas sp.]|tara:strand:+ start:350 stop:802 length:453 start_codon:yes stop_codon:yes gene_type:complete
MALLDTDVKPDWVDYNGHMNDAEYARVFSLAVDTLMERIGLDEAGRHRHGYTLYTLETHLRYLREAHQGQPLQVEVTLVDRDAKRLHLWFELHSGEQLLATSEQMLMGIDLDSGRPGPFPEAVDTAIAALPVISSPAPEGLGRRIGIVRR